MTEAESLYQDFLTKFPQEENGTVDYWKSGTGELSVLNEEGYLIVYDAINEFGRIIHDYRGLTDHESIVIFSDRLKRLMGIRKMNRTQLANASNISPWTISQYLNAKAEPKLNSLAKLATALNVSLDELIYMNFEF